MVDPKRIFPTCSGTGIIWAFCRCGARFCGEFLPILPVQNGEKAIEIITKRVYDVSSHVPSCGANNGVEMSCAGRPFNGGNECVPPFTHGVFYRVVRLTRP